MFLLYIGGIVLITKIQTLIKQSGKTPYRISKDSGLDKTTLYRLAKGEKKSIELRTAFKLADALGVDINDFRKED